MGSIPTIRVVNPAGGFMIINECDYDPSKHVLPGAKGPAEKKTEPQKAAPEASAKKSGGLKLTMMEPDQEPEAEAEAEPESEDDAGEDDAQDLRTMTIAELKEYARRNEIDLGDKTKKADLVRVIEKATRE